MYKIISVGFCVSVFLAALAPANAVESAPRPNPRYERHSVYAPPPPVYEGRSASAPTLPMAAAPYAYREAVAL